MSSALGELARPTIPIVIFYTVILVIVAIIGHIAIAIFVPKEANASVDERERKIFDRATHLSGYVFTIGVVLSLVFYLISYNGDMFFYTVLGSLIIGQLTEYCSQIYFYRAGA
ncbi:MAG: DUF2178 domain-containing protein [Halioglobus sp.]